MKKIKSDRNGVFLTEQNVINNKKIAFEGNIFIFGFGLVGQSFFRLLKKEVSFDIKKLFVIDKLDVDMPEFLKQDGLKENFIIQYIESTNYKDIYAKYLKKGDVLLDFSDRTKNINSLEWCLEHGVLYLSTSDSSWPDDLTWDSSYAHFVIMREIRKNYSTGYPTAVVQFGCNPGIVSVFAKKALEELIETSKSPYVIFNRKKLKHLLENDNYAEASRLLKLETIIITDYDTQQIKKMDLDDNTLYNTWNPDGLYDEACSNIEICVGTHYEMAELETSVKDYVEEDGYCMLNKRGVDVVCSTYSPLGIFDGHIITHEEVFSIGDYFSLKDDNEKSIYRPTVFFSYRPSDVAMWSLDKIKQKGYKNLDNSKIITDEIISGGEAVGIVIQGKRFKSVYYGSTVEVEDLKKRLPEETPTIIQVTASAIAAFKWMIKNPNEGMRFPEELPVEEILLDAQKYLGKYELKKVREKGFVFKQ